jgi:hypothetical protein
MYAVLHGTLLTDPRHIPSDPSGINLSSEEDEPPLQKSKSRAPENEWQIKSSLSHRTPGNTQALSSPAQPPTL